MKGRSLSSSPLLQSALMACVLVAGALSSSGATAADPAPVVPNASTYRFLVGFGPGGIPDLAARLIAEKLGERQKVPAIVVNKPGVGGTLAALDVLGAKPDGATLLSVTPAHATAPAIYRDMRYDTLKDFAPVTLIGEGPAVLVVPKDAKFKTLGELVAVAKANPGKLSYSSAGVGSSTHFAAELLRQQTGIEALHVPYKGVSDALTEVMAGRVDFTLAPYVTAAQLVKSGKVHALAVTGGVRMPEMPDVPTTAEAGLPEYQWSFWYGLLVSAKTPQATVGRLNQEFVHILNLPEVRTKLDQMGVAVAAGSSESFGELIVAEEAKFKAIAAAANILPQ